MLGPNATLLDCNNLNYICCASTCFAMLRGVSIWLSVIVQQSFLGLLSFALAYSCFLPEYGLQSRFSSGLDAAVANTACMHDARACFHCTFVHPVLRVHVQHLRNITSILTP